MLDRLKNACDYDGGGNAKQYSAGLVMTRFMDLRHDSILLTVRSRKRSAVTAMVPPGSRGGAHGNLTGMIMNRRGDAGRGKRPQQHYRRDKDVDQ